MRLKELPSDPREAYRDMIYEYLKENGIGATLTADGIKIARPDQDFPSIWIYVTNKGLIDVGRYEEYGPPTRPADPWDFKIHDPDSFPRILKFIRNHRV